MDVLHPRAALLANFEVLALLRALDADHLARSKSAAPDPSENLRTIELEAIQYLAAEHQPTLHQSEHAISRLVRDLAPFSLTKAEKLQVVNLAPTEPVELYVIVEELEDRLGDRMHDILRIVSNSLSTPAAAPPPSVPSVVETHEAEHAWDHDADDAVFDDLGEGAGIEGDLDIDDDD